MRTAPFAGLCAVVLLLGACSPSGQPVPIELQGTWLTTSRPAQPDVVSMSLTLGSCTSDRDCGRLEIVWDVGEPCAYSLAYDSDSSEGVNLRTTSGDSFACGWSPWSNAVVRVTPGADDSLTVDVPGAYPRSATLVRPRPRPGYP